jgi:hypothetical protein
MKGRPRATAAAALVNGFCAGNYMLNFKEWQEQSRRRGP